MRNIRGNRRELIDEDSDPSSLYETTELREILERALASLGKREETIIRHRYGFGAEEMTIVEIAKKIGISKSRVNSIQLRAFEKLVERNPILEKLRDKDRTIRSSGKFRINERVQVIGEDSDFIGFGKIIGFRKLFFSFPELYPEIELNSGSRKRRICDHRLRVYKERDAFRIANRMMNDLFPKEKKR